MANKGIYTKRNDGRKMDEVRPITAKVGIVPSADGSAFFQTGKTKAIAINARSGAASMKALMRFARSALANASFNGTPEASSITSPGVATASAISLAPPKPSLFLP